MNQERNYDNGMNEGGEGFNHHHDDAAPTATDPSSIGATIDKIRRELERIDCPAARESGAFDSAMVAELRSILEEVEQAEESCFLAKWDAKTTAGRKEAWNEWAKTVRGMTTLEALIELEGYEKSVGYTRADLKRAVKLHKKG